jgi:hypothetical protein
MTVADMLKKELSQQGVHTVKEAALLLGTSATTLRLLLIRKRIPKDNILTEIAKKLDLDTAALLLQAHRERLPRAMQSSILMPVPPAGGDLAHKRKWPLSQEQCDYLGRIMTSREIELVRMFRQMTPEEMREVFDYMGYLFQSSRSERAAADRK